MPFSSVAMIEKLALVRIAFCRAPALSNAFLAPRFGAAVRLAGIVGKGGTVSCFGHGRFP